MDDMRADSRISENVPAKFMLNKRLLDTMTVIKLQKLLEIPHITQLLPKSNILL